MWILAAYIPALLFLAATLGCTLRLRSLRRRREQVVDQGRNIDLRLAERGGYFDYAAGRRDSYRALTHDEALRIAPERRVLEAEIAEIRSGLWRWQQRRLLCAGISFFCGVVATVAVVLMIAR